MTPQDTQFSSLVREHSAMVYSVAVRLLGDPGVAEEVAQDVFLELHRWLPRLETGDHVRNWLRRTATHRATDAYRRRSVRPEGTAEEWDEVFERAGTAEPMHRGGAMESAMERMLLTLPLAQRTALVLRYGEDLSPEEIAKTTGQPLPTVKSNLQRGLQLLRRKGSVVLKEFVRG